MLSVSLPRHLPGRAALRALAILALPVALAAAGLHGPALEATEVSAAPLDQADASAQPNRPDGPLALDQVEGPFIHAAAPATSLDIDLSQVPSHEPPPGPVVIPPEGDAAGEVEEVDITAPEAFPGLDTDTGVAATDAAELAPDGPEALDTVAPTEFLVADPNFDGINILQAPSAPPDTVGDVGPHHYIQMTNGSPGSAFRIFDKQGNALTGVLDTRVTLWSGLPAASICRTDSTFDPIVIYDEMADRWLLTDINSGPPHAMCVAISQTNDPVAGGWHLYEFRIPTSQNTFPDYEKISAWPDAYYVSSFEGSNLGAYAFDRANMLNGNPAPIVEFQIGAGESNNGGRSTRLLPAELDGAIAPPDDAPGYFARIIDTEVHDAAAGIDRMELFSFDVDWQNLPGATFMKFGDLPVDPFDSVLCPGTIPDPGGRNCLPQPGTAVGLDPISNRLMWRLQYRNFGTHEAMVANHTIDLGQPIPQFEDGLDSPDQPFPSPLAGIRWYELRNERGAEFDDWELFQQGTHAPEFYQDNLPPPGGAPQNRWMGSIAMDKAGNMALGYSIGSSTRFASIAYTGRLATDPLGEMPQGDLDGDVTMMNGISAQTFTNRWGDYSSMNVDPVDGCTFWYTQEYMGAGGNWATRIGAFRFPTCMTADLGIIKDSYPVKVNAGEQKAYDIWVANHGPSEAMNVRVFDVLPDEVAYEIDTAGPMCKRADNYAGLRAMLSGDSTVPATDTDAMGTMVAVVEERTTGNGGPTRYFLHYALGVQHIDHITSVRLTFASTGATQRVLYGTGGIGTPPPPPPEFDTDQPLVGTIEIDAQEAVNVEAGNWWVWVVTTDFPDNGATGQTEGELAARLAPVEAGNVPLSCDVGDLAPGQSRHFTIYAEVDADTVPETTIANTAFVVSETDEPDGPVLVTPDGVTMQIEERDVTAEDLAALAALDGAPEQQPDPKGGVGKFVPPMFRPLQPNMSTSKNLVLAEADLKITKFGKPDGEVRAGDVLTYTVIVDNLGPSYAWGVSVKDLLQSSGNFEVLGVTSDLDASCSSEPNPDDNVDPFSIPPEDGAIASVAGRYELDCTLDAALPVLMADGPPNSGRWMLTLRVRALQGQDINNIATVVSEGSTDPNADNDMAMVQHELTDVADLGVDKVAVGEIQVDGEAGLIFNILVPDQPFPVNPNYETSPTQVTAGRRISKTLTVTNFGPSDAENVLLFDRLPAGVTLYPSSLEISQGGCETGMPGEVLDRFRCGLGDLAAGESATVSFQLLVDPGVPAGSMLENDVFVTSDTFDDNNANNHGNTQTLVNAWADMDISKLSFGEVVTDYDEDLRRFVVETQPEAVTAGKVLRYEIAVQNGGPSNALNVTIEDALPATPLPGPVEFLSADGAVCRPADVENEGTLWCTLGNMPAGSRQTFDIYVRVDPAVPHNTNLVNTATVLDAPVTPPNQPDPLNPIDGETSEAVAESAMMQPILPLVPDPRQLNNVANAPALVNAVADVFIAKVDVPAEARLDKAFEPDQALAGNEHRYLLRFGNDGPSNAVGIAIQDFLDFKQFGILGETFLRCEPFDIDDFVSCSEANGTVNVDLFLDQNEQIIGPLVPDLLKPGDEFLFWLIVEVDAGYVLDADDFIATNDSRITTTTNDLHAANNVDAHDTEIIAEADLSIEKADDLAGFLQCDPVMPGGMITYDLLVENAGPSDAADVYVVDWLPSEIVAVDPAQVVVTVNEGQVIEVRDDGRITVRVGNDPNNNNVDELGRLNAGSASRIRIEAMVRLDAECGAVAENLAIVETRQNNVDWPPAPDLVPGVGGGDRTPTVDPDGANNRTVEQTTVECPSIAVNKTVSFNGQCPGADLPRVFNRTAQPITFCFEVTNTGTTYLDDIVLVDQLRTRTSGMNVVVFTDTIKSGVDPKVPVAPGETVKRQVTLPHLTKECGIATDTVSVTANPVNSGRTDLPCLDDVTAEDVAVIDIPCAGVDWRLQLPVLEADECEAWVQVQNVGNATTKALLVIWGEAGFCPPQAAGPLKAECSGLLRPGSAWSFAESQIPSGAHSAVVYSLNTDLVQLEAGGPEIPFADVVCNEVFFDVVGDYFEWQIFDTAYRQQRVWNDLDFGAHTGEPLAASVNRACPDAADPNVTSHAAYTGISSDMEGAYDPKFGGFAFYAPLIFASKGELNSWLYIQNSGDECTSLEIWFKAQDNCLRPILGDVLSVAPGETVHFDPNTVVGPDWLGSAWIRGTQPLGIIVETRGPNHFTAYTGNPADVFELDFTYGNQVNYGPLVYSEFQGWDSAIQVQNLSAITAAKVKVYFLDRSGDIITTLVDWICPRGSQTFFLPVIDAIPGNWVGSVRVESQEWWSPGSPIVEPPRISSVVLLEKWADPARTTRREAVAYNAQTECLLYDWQIGSSKGGVTSGSAVFAIPLVAKGNRGITSEIAITNLVPKPGFTDFVIYLYDQNGLLDQVCEKLNEKQVEYIDLSTWGWVPPRFLGSLVVSAVFWEHDVFDPFGGFERNVVGLGGVAVERIGGTQGGPDVPGDESKAFEALPIFDHFLSEMAPSCPGLP